MTGPHLELNAGTAKCPNVVAISACPFVEDWADAVVPCPSERFEIVAIDKSPDSWFSFREPVEVGLGSLASEWLILRSQTLFIIGLALVGLAARWSATPISPDPAL